MRRGEAPEVQEEGGWPGLCMRPAWAWLALAAGLVAVSWPFWSAPSFRSPWTLFLYLFSLWAVMVAGLLALGRVLARRCDHEGQDGPDEAGELGTDGDV